MSTLEQDITTTTAVPALKIFPDDQAGTQGFIGTANFRVTPPQTNDLTVTRNDGAFQNDHFRYGNGQQASVGFDLGAGPLPPRLWVRLAGLVSRNGDQPGYAPITITVNGQVVVADFTVPGSGFGATEAAFPVPVQALRNGMNSYTIQVAGDARTFFWLYEMGVAANRIMAANLTVDPPQTSAGIAVTRNDGQFQSDHFRYGNNQELDMQFQLEYVGDPREQVLLAVTGLASRNGDQPGYSPISILVNGNAVVQAYTTPGEGFGAYTSYWVVREDFLRQGSNDFTLRVGADAQTFYWLYSVVLTEMVYAGAVGSVSVAVSPPQASGLAVTVNEGSFSGDRTTYGNSQSFGVSFALGAPQGLLLSFNGLVSRNGDQPGYSPVTLTLNGNVIVSDYTVPGDGFGYQDNRFYAPPGMAVAGTNQLTLQVSADAQTYFWLRTEDVASV
jgi:hypothetical protein